MARPRSRVAEEARTAEMRAREVRRQIRDLSRQIAHPEKLPEVPRPSLSASTVERFHRYFAVRRTERGERAKPTRAEMRRGRNQAIVWVVIAVMLLVWVIGKFSRLFW